MEDKETFELSLSQEVSLLQTKYTLYKQVINILAAMSYKEEFNRTLMTEAINLAIERNDCLRLFFFKEHKQIKQYFRDSVVIKNIPYLEFNSKIEFDNWYKKYRKSAIKYLKGNVFEPAFIKNYNGEYLVFVKVCHMILDVYGINVVFKDINGIYNALKNGEELPPLPGEYKKVLINDLKIKNDKERIKNNEEFFNHYLDEKKEPMYACVTGTTSKVWGKRYAQGKRSQKMFFLHCDTTPYGYDVDQSIVDKVNKYALENKISVANIYFFAYSIAASLQNGRCTDMLPLELSNCRGTISEKKCAGTKVQSVGCYTSIDYEKDFDSQMKHFSELQAIQYKHLGFRDTDFEMMLHKYFKYPMLGSYYHLTFSLIPYESNKDYEMKIYSNGKGALSCYLAMMLDINTGKVFSCYDIQDEIGGEKEIHKYHDLFMSVLNQVMDNPNILLKDLK